MTIIKLFLVLPVLFLFSTSCSETDQEPLDPVIEVPNTSNLGTNPPPKIITSEDSLCHTESVEQIDPAKFDQLLSIDLKNISNNILTELNRYRKTLGLPEFTPNRTAKFLALKHNKYQMQNNKINHEYSRYRSCTIIKLENATATGENVAIGYKTAKAVVQAWLNSPKHLKTIQRDFTRIGIATTKNKKGVYYYTNVFFK